HVEHGGLAGAVGADDGAHLPLADVEGDVAQGLHAAEGKRDVLHLQQGFPEGPLLVVLGRASGRSGKAALGRGKGVHSAASCARACSATKCLTSAMARSPSRRPLRPSSKVTSTEACTRLLPS